MQLVLLSAPICQLLYYITSYFPGSSEVKASACNAGDLGLIPGLGRSPGEGNGNPIQYSFLPGESHGWRRLVGYSPQGRKESDTIQRLYYYTSSILLYFSKYCKIKKCFIFCVFFMYYLCEKYYKSIIVQYYIANCVSWVPRLTLLGL